MIVGIPPLMIFEVYPLVKNHFEVFAKLSMDDKTAYDFALDVANRDRQLWVVQDSGILACALTEVRGKTVDLDYCSGVGREEWEGPLMDHIMAWAQHIGAERLRTTVRAGWTPFLKKWGMRERYRIMERDIGQKRPNDDNQE